MGSGAGTGAEGECSMIEIPHDIRTGEPIVSPEAWARMSEDERRLCAYQNSPMKQRIGEMYRRKGDECD